MHVSVPRLKDPPVPPEEFPLLVLDWAVVFVELLNVPPEPPDVLPKTHTTYLMRLGSKQKSMLGLVLLPVNHNEFTPEL